MSKRGILAVRAIVIAALLLVVLIVVIFVFKEKIFSFAETFESCTFRGGHCDDSCEADEGSIENTDCPNLCCVSFTEEKQEKIKSEVNQQIDSVYGKVK